MRNFKKVCLGRRIFLLFWMRHFPISSNFYSKFIECRGFRIIKRLKVGISNEIKMCHLQVLLEYHLEVDFLQGNVLKVASFRNKSNRVKFNLSQTNGLLRNLTNDAIQTYISVLDWTKMEHSSEVPQLWIKGVLVYLVTMVNIMLFKSLIFQNRLEF